MKFTIAVCVISLACAVLAFGCWFSMSLLESLFGCECSDDLDNDSDEDDILTEDEDDVE